ncbi:hypothetical protein RN001_006358 [Aquatica leii]|uniref:PiggyBac transposable element-derived protein domain-containing protein n=1 Tax=Aquatica leii TaxID=1421715 RepID=A0AAN7Q1N0_9COLE|nr:hypothetical protein RN001_006358 [Aquatica leii]
MPLYEEEHAKLLRLHEILKEILSDPESEDDEEDAAATEDILGTYVLDVNNHLVPITSDENIVGLTTYDNLNSDQHIEFEDSMNIDEVNPPQDESDSDDDTPIAVRLYKQGVNWDSQCPHISKRDKFDEFSGPNVVDVKDALDIFLTLFRPDLIDKFVFETDLYWIQTSGANIPKQIFGPSPNGIYAHFGIIFLFCSLNRSGSNASGFG